MGLSEMASYGQDGSAEASPVFPWKLRFSPNSAFQFPSTVAEGYTDFKDDLATIAAGTKIFDVYAWDNPEELGGTESLIA